MTFGMGEYCKAVATGTINVENNHALNVGDYCWRVDLCR